MVLPRGVLHPRPGDLEDRHPSAVCAVDLDRLKLAPTDEPEGAEEEVVGLKHVALPCGLREERWVTVRTGRGEPVSPLLFGPASGVRQDLPDVGPPVLPAAPEKPCQEENDVSGWWSYYICSDYISSSPFS